MWLSVPAEPDLMMSDMIPKKQCVGFLESTDNSLQGSRTNTRKTKKKRNSPKNAKNKNSQATLGHQDSKKKD